MATPNFVRSPRLDSLLKPGEVALVGSGGKYVYNKQGRTYTYPNRKPDRVITLKDRRPVGDGQSGRFEDVDLTYGVYTGDPLSEGFTTFKKAKDNSWVGPAILATAAIGGAALGAYFGGGTAAAGTAGTAAAGTAAGTAAAGTAAAGTGGIGGLGSALLGLSAGAMVPSLLAKNPKLPAPPQMSPESEPMPLINDTNLQAQRRKSVASQRRRSGRASTILSAVTPEAELLGG